MRSLKEQYRIQDEILKDRLYNLLPKLMRECRVEMWVVLSEEYNEDPVFKTLVPSLVKNASRITCLVFTLSPDGSFEALNVSRPNPRFEGFYRQAMNPKDDVLQALAHLIEERQPANVAVDISNECAIADGLSKNLYDRLKASLCTTNRLISAEKLVIRWIETRTEKEFALYPEIYKLATDVIDQVYTADIIKPGITTTTDVEWEIMQRINAYGLDFWFAPDVDLQRIGEPGERISDVTIQEGDLVHCDMGLVFAGLHTDTQRLLYVGKDGEKQIPQGILRAFRTGNRYQDLVRGEFKAGRTGNEIFFEIQKKALSEGIDGMVYCHPLGTFGHSAGPSVGMYDNQGFVPGHGELVMHDNTCYALELNIHQTVPEWKGQNVCVMLEESIGFKDGQTFFFDDKREIIHFIE